MVLDSSDLQHRRTSASIASSKRSTRSNGSRRISSSSSSAATSHRRRRRKVDPNRAALAATILFAGVVIPIVWIIHRLLGRGTDRSVEKQADAIIQQQQQQNDGNSNHFLTNWKPKQHRKIRDNESNNSPPIISSSIGPEAEERAVKREQRYQSLYQPKFDSTTLGYDIYNCPPTPPPNYPYSWKTTQLLTNWEPTDVTTISPKVRHYHQSLCIFDYTNQYSTALTYRNAEKPFIIKNDPKVTQVARRWEDDTEYLHRIFGDTTEYRTERSPTNQFMWYRLRGSNSKRPKGYVKPENDEIEMTFGEYLEHALLKDGIALGEEELVHKAKMMKERRLNNNNSLLLAKKDGDGVAKEEDDPLSTDDATKQQQQQQQQHPQRHHKHTNEDEDSEEKKESKYYYFRLNADLRSAKSSPTSPSKFIYDELPFFDPRKNNKHESEFYIVNPDQERGINCRFGMRGVTAANHFDMSRNMIAVFGGERRYILSHPDQCSNMALYPKGHPSVRHSSIDWSKPAEWTGEFQQAMSNEVVLHAGDVLYLPTNWFHYIVNLSLNYQCNARSGTTYETAEYIDKCGFDMKRV